MGENVRVLIIGDTHFKHNRLKEGSDFVEACVSRARTEAPDFIVCLGDTLDTHNIVHVQPHKLAFEFLKQLSRIAPTYLIIGNHDLINHKQFLTDNHIFNPYKYWTNLTIVDKPITVSHKNFQFAMCPYVPNGLFKKALDTLLEPTSSFHWEVDVDCIFAHQEFHGCKMSAVVSADGDRWSLIYPPVISGHIHEAQDLVEDNVYYPGSVSQHSYGEKKAKRLWLVTFADNLIPFGRELIDLGLRRKRVVRMDVNTVNRSFVFDWTKQDDIKLELTGTCEQFGLFRKAPIYSRIIDAGVKVSFIADVQANVPVFVSQSDAKLKFKSLLEGLVKTKNDSNISNAFAELGEEAE